ncbi:hypothetical protein [Paenibacillus illinoisensis]|uniref:hypothetical protein n=1 Tax=Paenibacillus illinoisensis TaxID=59845 RepID=UPI00301D6235
MGTVILQMQETVFWRCTPKRLFALWEIHKRVNGLEEKDAAPNDPSGYINQFI